LEPARPRRRTSPPTATPTSQRAPRRRQPTHLRPSPSRGPPPTRRSAPPAHELSRRPLEEELPPGGPPVVAARDDRARVNQLDARPEAELRRRDRGLELDPDLGRLTRVVWLDRLQVRDRLLRARLDQLPCAGGRKHPRAQRRETLLDGDGREPVAEERLRLAA